jgi:hypothetical protein
LDDSVVRISNDWLKQANSKSYHHFFPKAFLRRKGYSDWLRKTARGATSAGRGCCAPRKRLRPVTAGGGHERRPLAAPQAALLAAAAVGFRRRVGLLGAA